MVNACFLAWCLHFPLICQAFGYRTLLNGLFLHWLSQSLSTSCRTLSDLEDITFSAWFEAGLDMVLRALCTVTRGGVSLTVPFFVSFSKCPSARLGPALVLVLKASWPGVWDVAERESVLAAYPKADAPFGEQLVLCWVAGKSSWASLRIYPLLPTVEPWGASVSVSPFSMACGWVDDLSSSRSCWTFLSGSVLFKVPFSSSADFEGSARLIDGSVRPKWTKQYDVLKQKAKLWIK